MKKVTYFDVEWANGKNKSICQMGVMCENYEDGEPIYPESNIYVNPEDKFDEICMQVHGICAERVADKPTFPEVWKEIEPCFIKSIIIGHNVAGADLDALTKALQRYNIDIPELYYVDTLEIARTFVPPFAVENYSMSTLCKYFGVDIDTEHDAFDDACANKDLLIALANTYHFSIDKFVRRYSPNENFKFVQYVSNPLLRKAISDFYGVIQGISIDGNVSNAEFEYIQKWKKENCQYSECAEVSEIIEFIDEITSDGVITSDELHGLHGIMTKYFQTLSSSEITIATQVLAGILKGIASDKEVTFDECNELRKWLYKNEYLRGHFPFDRIMELLDKVLEDNQITEDESSLLLSEIDGILNPVATIKSQISDVKGQNVCLSGNFAYGPKAKVEHYIDDRGGVIVGNVSKKLNILIIGDMECEAYAHGTYGTKTKKALELIAQGCPILLIKEKEFFAQVK